MVAYAWITAKQEATGQRLWFRLVPGKTTEALSKRVGGGAQVAECFPTKCKALSSDPSKPKVITIVATLSALGWPSGLYDSGQHGYWHPARRDGCYFLQSFIFTAPLCCYSINIASLTYFQHEVALPARHFSLSTLCPIPFSKSLDFKYRTGHSRREIRDHSVVPCSFGFFPLYCCAG
jgi:hypothetical protein